MNCKILLFIVSVFFAFYACSDVALCSSETLAHGLQSDSDKDDLPAGVMRGPLLHEHSFIPPLVYDWWKEGIPHFMIGGSAIATDRFIRLTGNSMNDKGFLFNTASVDVDNWEVRVKLSIRPPPMTLLSNWHRCKGISKSQTLNSSTERYTNSSPVQSSQNHLRLNHCDCETDKQENLGGEGMALWYLPNPIGDDHQHVLKYSKSISVEVEKELLDLENPWRMADVLLNTEDDDGDDDDSGENALDINFDDLTEKEQKERVAERERRRLKRQHRHEVYRRLFKRGTSVDDSNDEKRIMGVKYSDFSRGFVVILDSTGHDEVNSHFSAPSVTTTQFITASSKYNANEEHIHNPRVSVLLNLPAHTAGGGVHNDTNKSFVINNFDATSASFRAPHTPVLLQCDYNFRQAASRRYTSLTHTPTNLSHEQQQEEEESSEWEESKLHRTLLNAPEEPVELIVRYYHRKLSVILRREMTDRRVARNVNATHFNSLTEPSADSSTNISTDNKGLHYNNNSKKSNKVDRTVNTTLLQRTYKETLCGELYPVDIPLHYHFGISASTGKTPKRQRTSTKHNNNSNHQHHHDDDTDEFVYSDDDDDVDNENTLKEHHFTHVDVHEVLKFEFRELGRDARAMGYSKTIPVEYYNYEKDKREREHFSRRIPDKPDSDDTIQ